MSDDLISRRTIKFLIEMIRDCWAISPYVSANDMKLYLKVFIVVLTEISNCPTAFDKEKVIEELKRRRDCYDMNEEPLNAIGSKEYIRECADIREHKGKWIAYDEAIKVIEKGGTE